MSEHKHITIGGVQYDAHTGLRVETAAAPEAPSPRTSSHAHSIHKKASRTKTLSRSHVKAPHKPKIANQPTKKNPMVKRFASQDIVPRTKPARVISDIAPTKHPIQNKVAVRQATAPAKQNAPKATHVAKQPTHQQNRHPLNRNYIDTYRHWYTRHSCLSLLA